MIRKALSSSWSRSKSSSWYSARSWPVHLSWSRSMSRSMSWSWSWYGDSPWRAHR